MKGSHNSKAQVNTIDLVLASVLLIFIIALFEFAWQGAVARAQPSEEELSLRAYHVANTLLESGGYPANWTPSNVEVIGICDERNVINKDKLANLITLLNTDYEKAKRLLGLGSDELYINVTDPYNNIVYVNGIQASAGMPPSSAVAAAHSSSVMQISSLVRSNNSIAIVFDQSGSMSETLPDGQTKIDAAKTAVNNFLLHVIPGDEIAVTTFRNCGNVYTAQGFTTDINLVRWAVYNMSAYGWTPLAGVTAYTGNYTGNYARNRNKMMIVLSDGEETCNGDPAAAATYAMSRGVDVIHTIGFVLEPGSEGERELQEMASIGGGNYYPANNSQELYEAFVAAYESSEKQVVVNIVVWR